MVLLPCNNCCQCFECQYTKSNCLIVTFDGFSHSDESCNECDFLDDSSFVLTRTWNSTPIVSASVVAAAGTGAAIATAIQKTDAGHYEVTDIKLASGGSGYSEDAAVKFGVSYGSATCKPPRASLTVGRAAPEITASITSETGVGAKLGVTLAGPSGPEGSELWSVSAVDVLAAGSEYKDDDAVTFSVKSGVEQSPASAKILVNRSQPTINAKMADPSLGWVSLSVKTGEFEDKSGKKYWSVDSLNATLGDDDLFANGLVIVEPEDNVVTLEAADVYASVTAVVSGVNITSAGFGYTAPPAVVFSGGGGSGATATANLINGEVASVTIDSPGTGYTSAPSVTFSTTAGGFGAAGEAQISGQYFSAKISPAGKYYADGGVASVEVIDGGEYYRPDAITSVTLEEQGEIFPEGACAFGWIGCQSCPVEIGPLHNTRMFVSFDKLNDLYVIQMGWYALTVVNKVQLTGPIQYTFRATTPAPNETFDSIDFPPESFLNAVQFVSLASGGSSYSSPPSVVFSEEHGSGAEAAASISGSVASISVTNGGNGYSQSQPPVVQLSGGNGVSASAVAIVSTSGQVSSVSVTSGGYGYSSPPTVSFVDENGSGAEATAAISGAVVDVTVTKGGLYKYPPDVSFTGGGGSGAAATATLASLPILRSGCHENGTITVSGTDCDTETSQKNCRNFPDQLVANLSGFGPVSQRGSLFDGWGTCPEEPPEQYLLPYCGGPNSKYATYCEDYDLCGGQCGGVQGFVANTSPGYAMIAKDTTVILDRQENIVPGWSPNNFIDPGNAGDNCNVIVYSGSYAMLSHTGRRQPPDCAGNKGTVGVTFSPAQPMATVAIAAPTGAGGTLATASVSKISDGGVQSISVDFGGSGYASEIHVVVEPGDIIAGVKTDTGLGAAFSVETTSTGHGNDKRWHISKVSVDTGGSKYSPGDYLTFSVEDGEIESPPSSGWYVTLDRLEPTVAASPSQDSPGSGAAFAVSLLQATDGNGLDVWTVDAISVQQPGSGYGDGEQISISCPDGVEVFPAVANIKVDRYQPTVAAYIDSTAWIGTGAAFAVSMTKVSDHWEVSSVSILSGGSQYSPGTSISFSPSPQTVSPESAYAYVSSTDQYGAITAVAVFSGGNYYATNGIVQEVSIASAGEYYKTTGEIVGVLQDTTGGGAFFKSLATGVVEVDTPEIAIFGGAVATAEAEAEINTDIESPQFGSITAIAVTNPGEGYVSPEQAGWIVTITHQSEFGGMFRNYTVPSALPYIDGSPLVAAALPDSSRMAACAEDLFDGKSYPMYMSDSPYSFIGPQPAVMAASNLNPREPLLAASMANPSLEWIQPGAVLSRVASQTWPPVWSVSAVGATLDGPGLCDYSPVTFEVAEIAPWTTVIGGATATIAVTAVVSKINVTDGGSEYSSPPDVVISGGLIAGGVPATAHAVVVDGSVDSIVVDQCGFGYIGVPTVTISGNATAQALLDGQYVSTKLESRGLYGTTSLGIPAFWAITQFTGPITVSLSQT